MEALNLQQAVYTEAEYFELLNNSQHKIEFLDGTIRMMSGGKVAHNDIIDNLTHALGRNPGGCKLKNSDNAVAIKSVNAYFFPDLTAVCGEPNYLEGGIAKLTNPSLIIEVLSKSTADYDRGDKFRSYRKLQSFKEYVLVDSQKPGVDTFYRETEDYWIIRSYWTMDQSVEFKSLGLSVPMATIYEDITFEETTPFPG